MKKIFFLISFCVFSIQVYCLDVAPAPKISSAPMAITVYGKAKILNVAMSGTITLRCKGSSGICILVDDAGDIHINPERHNPEEDVHEFPGYISHTITDTFYENGDRVDVYEISFDPE